jgi:uncharacterized protein (TIGR02421 family)
MTTEVEAGRADARRAVRDVYRDRGALEGSWEHVRLVLDGSRPFLLVLRGAGPGEPVGRLVQGEASVLRAGPDAEEEAVREIVRAVAEAGTAEHDAFLVVELWTADDGTFRVQGPDGPAPGTVRALAEGLRTLEADGASGEVVVEATEERHPPGRPPLLTVSECHELGCLLVGVAVPPLWSDADTGEVFPVFLRRLAHAISRVLRGALFEFVKVQGGSDLGSYRALGRRTLDDDVWDADRRLAEIDASFDALLLVAPVNADAAWERFRDGGYDRPPEFRYRLLPIDPDLVKRDLYEIRLERIEDPAAWRLLRDKREELDKQITLVAERNTPEFLHASARLYGHIGSALLDRAEEILAEVPTPGGRRAERHVGAHEFADRARSEFDHYRAVYPAFESEVQVRPDLVGLMVSSGRLLVGEQLRLRPDRVEALIQHEIGTHVLTFVNGAAQPFLQLAHGFADYDELQEGLGVLAEYLVGGLSRARMRLLAARVVAVSCRMDGASFVDTFRRLNRDHGFTARTSFNVAARVYQSGGFTRDIIYLRGLLQVVEYLREGGELEPLYVGKIAARHLEVVRELRERGVLRDIPLLPRFLEWDEARDRLRALRDGLPVHAMVTEPGDPE